MVVLTVQVRFDPRAEQIAIKLTELIEVEALKQSKDTVDRQHLAVEVYEVLHFAYLAAKHNKGGDQ